MSNETIFNEVNDELRGDRMRALWRSFGPWLIGAAVLIVVAVAANEGWRWWQNSTAARSSDQFYAALELGEAGDIEAAQAALNEVIASGSGGYPSLARFRQASLLARDGKTAEAVAAYDALATAESNQHLRDLALVLAANLLVDGGDVGAVQQRVAGLAEPGNPMRGAAREAIGLVQYKAGELDAALETFRTIAEDPLTNRELLGRVQIYVAQLVAQGAMTAEDRAAAEAASTVVTDTPIEADVAPAEAMTPALPEEAPVEVETPVAVEPSPAPAMEAPVEPVAPAAVPEEPPAAPVAEDSAPAMAPAAEEPLTPAPEAIAPAPVTPPPATAPAETPAAPAAN